MTTIDTTGTSAAAFTGIGLRVARAIEQATARIADRAARRATYRALDRLTDRELDDIGLTRDAVTYFR